MNANLDVKVNANTEIADGPSSRDSSHPPTLASCTLCRRRKVKCDRTLPCGNCQRSKAECVPFIPSRAARGRQGGRKRKREGGEILERIAKLEGLVRSIEGHDTLQGEQEKTAGQGTVGDINTKVGGGPPEVHDRSQPVAPRLEKYLATSFWVSLSEEIHGLKDVFGGSSDDGEEDEIELATQSDISNLGQQHLQQSNHSGFAILRTTIAGDIIPPNSHQVYTFCDIYLANVDPIFKILHGPSLRRYLQENAAELDCSPGRGGLEALRFAIFYAAVTSMDDGECRYRIGEDRTVLLARYRAGTESALAKADFLNTVEMSTLQALGIYLVSVRANDTSRLTWMLTSLAVRIAEAIGLNHDSTASSFQPFENEMRRRLWWQICDLDSHASEDRASNPLIAANSFSTKLPLHINDEDISLNSFEEVREREGYTDMTFALSCNEVLDGMRKLSYVPASGISHLQVGPQEVRGQSVDTIIKLQRRIEEKYLRHLNLTRPFHWFIRMVADIITAVMWLLVYRPMRRRPDSVPSSQIAHPDILRLSVDVLERFHQLQTDPAASQFRWVCQTYVQWHALAVTIAELCVEKEGPMVERAWAIVEPAFQQQAHHVADSDKGMLWRPIKKLMSRARGVREEYLTSRLAPTTPSSSVAILNTINAKDPSIGTVHSNFDTKGHALSPMKSMMRPIQGYQQANPIATSEPFDWDPWLTAATAATTTTTHSQYNSSVDDMAWMNWEDFVDDFQGQGDAVSGLNAFTSGHPSA
ncbi:MAG: hypothetical protein ASARMPREDX12_006340 [Alectoria sarmentosa]|nr:MAG: hypothetical protein ASARMPREDX12_006340 [Alectoria sarmentosa]